MDKSIENVRSSELQDEVAVLGTASVETKGPADRNTEYLGSFVPNGIAAE